MAATRAVSPAHARGPGDGDAEGAALRASEDRFRTLIEHVGDIVVELDQRSLICWLSPSIETVLGRRPEELVGRTIRPIVHPDDLGVLRDGLDRAYGQMQAVDFSYRLLHADGSWRWIEGGGRCFFADDGTKHFVGVGRDVTESKRLLTELERRHEADQRVQALSRRFLSAATVDLQEAVLEALAGTASIVGADRVYLEPFRTSSRAPIEGAFDAVEWQADGLSLPRPSLTAWCLAQVRSGAQLVLDELSGFAPAPAEDVQALMRAGVRGLIAIPLYSQQGPVGLLGVECHRTAGGWSEQQISLLGVLGELYSTTLQRLQAEEALQSSRDQLLHAQKMDAIGRLAGGIAHDFNNLLTIILGYSRALQEDLGPVHARADDVGDITRAAERAADLTRQLLAFSRRDPSQAERIDLNEAVDGVRDMMRRLLESHVDLDFELSTTPCAVWCDPRQIEQVLINLVVNARDAIAGGGRIAIRTRHADVSEHERRRLGLAAPGRYEVLEVEDAGEGMSEAVRQRIFEPFYSTKDVGQGTGLGLSIAYGVANEHGGTIRVQSKIGEGTVVTLLLPHSFAPARPVPQAAASGVPAHTVLVVDDEPAVRRLIVRILERAGYGVLEADGGPSALEIAREHGAFDLLLTDMRMAEMSGGELAARLRAQHPGLPVVYVSGQRFDGAGGRADHPPGDWVQKPFDAEGLLAPIRAALADA